MAVHLHGAGLVHANGHRALAPLALDVADHAVILANGAVAAAGAPADLKNDKLLQAAYLAA